MSLLCRVGIHDWYESPQGVFCSRCGRQMLLDGEISSTNAAHIYATEVDSWQPGQIVLEEFRVERELGKGGMGIVYLLVNTHNGQQFAAKRTKLVDDKARKEFLREMQGWLDLPPHPNVLPLRFLRTVGAEQVIFTEHMDGGSLQDWLRKRKLSDLATVLDVAIQYAWGLHALHELGQVHQDVKPGNALLDKTGVLKVADFGLMRARHYGGIAQSTANSDSTVGDVQATHAGNYTPAYCSPEQARGEKLTKHTDTWSWGLSVLAMFYRTNPTDTGPTAFRALAKLAALPTMKHLALPKAVAAVLNRCFQDKPEDRWPSLLDAANVLVELYPTLCGQPYPRLQPTFIAAHERLQIKHEGSWKDPCLWLEDALQADGRDPTEAKRMIAVQASSRKGQVAGNLALYDAAYQILNRLVQSGNNTLSSRLAALCTDKASIHNYLDDPAGRMDMLSRAIEIYEYAIKYGGQKELEPEYASSLQEKGIAHSDMGQLAPALEFYDRAIDIYNRLVKQQSRQYLEPELATCLGLKAKLLSEKGKETEAIFIYDQVINIFQCLIQAGQMKFEQNLARILHAKGMAIQCTVDSSQILPLYDQSISILQRIEEESALIHVLNSKAVLLMHNGKASESVEIYDRIHAIFQRQIEQEGRRGEIEPGICTNFLNKALAFRYMGLLPDAAALCDEAIAIMKRLVEQEGRRDLEEDLAGKYLNKGVIVAEMGQLPEAIALYDQAISIRQRLIKQDGRRELEGSLAIALKDKANALEKTENFLQSAVMYDQIISIYRRKVLERGNSPQNEANFIEKSNLEANLAAYMRDQSIVFKKAGQLSESVEINNQAIEMFKNSINTVLSIDKVSYYLLEELATTLANKAITVSEMGQLNLAVMTFDELIGIYELIIKENVQRLDLTEQWARAVLSRSSIMANLGNTVKARADALMAINKLEIEIDRTDSDALKQLLRQVRSSTLSDEITIF